MDELRMLEVRRMALQRQRREAEAFSAMLASTAGGTRNRSGSFLDDVKDFSQLQELAGRLQQQRHQPSPLVAGLGPFVSPSMAGHRLAASNSAALMQVPDARLPPSMIDALQKRRIQDLWSDGSKRQRRSDSVGKVAPTKVGSLGPGNHFPLPSLKEKSDMAKESPLSLQQFRNVWTSTPGRADVRREVLARRLSRTL